MSETTAIEPVESVSSLPSGDPVDAAAPPASVPQPKPSPPVASALAAAPYRADDFVSHLFRCIQTRAGADVVLMFLCYAARVSGTALEALSRTVLRHSARRLVALAFKLPPETTVVLTSAPAPTAATLALQLSARLKAFSGLLSEWRTMGRLFGLLGLYFSAKKLLAKSFTRPSPGDPEKKELALPSKPASFEERFDTFIAYAQVLSLISFQSAENIAYLSSKKILGFSPATQGKLARWSVRSWALYIGMELGRLLVERSRKKSGGAAAADAAWAQQWRTSFSRNLSWAPLTVHWSVDNGPLSEWMIGLFALYPASGQMKDLWKSTA